MPPSKREILEKYRDVISNEDFELLVRNEFPSPESLHQENASLQFLGSLNGWWVFAKRYGGKVITGIVLLGDGLIPGLEYIDKYSRVAYEKVWEYVALGSKHCNIPATQYVVSDQPIHWALPSEQPMRMVTTTTTTTSTTTTTPAPEDSYSSMPPGSGMAPYSPKWEGVS